MEYYWGDTQATTQMEQRVAKKLRNALLDSEK